MEISLGIWRKVKVAGHGRRGTGRGARRYDCAGPNGRECAAYRRWPRENRAVASICCRMACRARCREKCRRLAHQTRLWRPARPDRPELLSPRDVPHRKPGSPEGRIALLHARGAHRAERGRSALGTSLRDLPTSNADGIPMMTGSAPRMMNPNIST